MLGKEQYGARKGTIRLMSPEELLKLEDQVEKGECLLVDVRGSAEFEASHISRAKLIPLFELEQRKAELDRGRMVVVYCRTGTRAMRGAQILCDSGFESVYVLKGGISDWEKLMSRAHKGSAYEKSG
jgi:rhodanese-related sulfurtransferase